MAAPFELIADCPKCLVDGAVLELFDPREAVCAWGISVEARCRVCSAKWRGDYSLGPELERTSPRAPGHCPGCGHRLTDVELSAHACGQCGSRARSVVLADGEEFASMEALQTALERFAREEYEPELTGFLQANFLEPSLTQIYARLRAKERVETSFDALFSLFQRSSGGAGGSAGSSAPVETKARQSLPPPAKQPSYEPRAMLHALVSVLAADGEQHPGEQAFLESFLTEEKLQALAPEEYCVHRPATVSPRIPPEKRLYVLEKMVQLACVDGEADGSELRIIRAYAGQWNIPDSTVERWLEQYKLHYASETKKWLYKLRSFFFEAPNKTDDGLGGRA